MYEALKFINKQMEAIGIPYEFGQWSSEVKYPYYVGEITVEPITTEDGYVESDMIVTGYNRGKLIDLINHVNKMKSHFSPVYGLRGNTDSGGSIAVFFDMAFPVTSGESSLKKMEIHLKIKEWKGAI